MKHEFYLEIWFNGVTYDVNVRVVGSNEQHEVWEFDTLEEVTTFVQNYYEKTTKNI